MSMFILKVSHISLKKGSINKNMEGEMWYLNRPILKNFINISESSWIIAECLKTAPNKGKRHFHLQVFEQQAFKHFLPLKL